MRVKGFGGVFWRSNDVDKLTSWYKNTLGIVMEGWNGTIIKPDADNETVFSIISTDDDYFPKVQAVMLNFQVENIQDWIDHFHKIGVPLLKGPEKSEYGTFVWITDPDERWIELWEK